MRKYIGRLYVDYLFFNIFVISMICIVLISVIFKVIGFDKVFGVGIYLIMWILLGLVFSNHCVVVMLREKYEYNTFFEITDEHFKLASTSIYTFYKLEKVAPLRNILDYTIKQNILSKRFNVFRVNINCGSDKLSFYISGKDIIQLENNLLKILENNLNYRCTDPKKLDQKSNFLEVGIFMSKYTFELKKKVVLEYLNGGIGYIPLAKKYGIKSEANIKVWVSKYKKYGDEALLRSRKNKEYSFEKKIFVVELYLTSELSYNDIALQEGINNPSLICNWVNLFRVAGPGALRERRKGRKISMAKSTKKLSKKTSQTTNDNISKEYVKELENQLLQLRIENAFLKEARRLRLAEEAEMKRRREL